MFIDLEILKILSMCELDSDEKSKFEQEISNMDNKEKHEILLILKNLKETNVIKNIEVVENLDGELSEFQFLEAPYLTGIGERYLNAGK